MDDQDQNKDEANGEQPYPEYKPMDDAESACKIGDLLELVAPLDLIGTAEEDDPSVVQPSGQIYKVVALFGRGWDLELVSGDGPKEVRALNRFIKVYFKHVSR